MQSDVALSSCTTVSGVSAGLLSPGVDDVLDLLILNFKLPYPGPLDCEYLPETLALT